MTKETFQPNVIHKPLKRLYKLNISESLLNFSGVIVVLLCRMPLVSRVHTEVFRVVVKCLEVNKLLSSSSQKHLYPHTHSNTHLKHKRGKLLIQMTGVFFNSLIFYFRTVLAQKDSTVNSHISHT